MLICFSFCHQMYNPGIFQVLKDQNGVFLIIIIFKFYFVSFN